MPRLRQQAMTDRLRHLPVPRLRQQAGIEKSNIKGCSCPTGEKNVSLMLHTLLLISDNIKNLALRSREAFIQGSTLKFEGRP